jgi:hypothetical protein
MSPIRYTAPRRPVVKREAIYKQPVPPPELPPEPPQRDIVPVASPDWEHRLGVKIRGLTVRKILEAASKVSGFTIEELISPRRAYALTAVRQCVMYYAREHTALSLPQIGKYLGGRDHSTVLHAVRKIEMDLEKYRKIVNGIDAVLAVDSARNVMADLRAQIKSDRIAA